MHLPLTKHHGLGNDFLVLLDLSATLDVDGDLARAVCNRTTGIGADGLIRARLDPDGADVRMELWNSDGSVAELSGNGLRCLAQALVLSDTTSTSLKVATAGGTHALEVTGTDLPGVHEVEADMGPVELEGKAKDWLLPGVVDAAFARIENPHLVLLAPDPATAPDLDTVGREANDAVEGGINVEMIRSDGDALILDVYERGAGRTQACGTGACAAAAVARHWGLVGDRVIVRMPGGAAHVGLGDTVSLAGPIEAVARVEYPWP
ncbi:MAG: diaminopimelate epimerase [Acidimicrobiales bacterium]